jgi:pantoate--beta-alanine ligase
MKLIRTIKEIQSIVESYRQQGKIVGFVPTMGCFHEGHLSLMRIARKGADVVVVSIYVNPTQFDPGEDFESYPRQFERDEKLAEQERVDILFYPSDKEMYPKGYLTYVTVNKITKVLCGVSRPHHFEGVTTICTKLFHVVKPHFAVFGQKDAQQAIVIQRMVEDLNFDMEIVVGPIIREKDGLAMSSRNKYLSPEERKDALSLFQSLQLAERLITEGERTSKDILSAMKKLVASRKGTRIDYIEIVDATTLKALETIKGEVLIALAVFVGNTRLIDNIVVNC